MSESARQGHVADTHVIVWHVRNDTQLSTPARQVLQRADRGEQWVYVSAITLVEMVYLAERGRLDGLLVERVFRMMEIPMISKDERIQNAGVVQVTQFVHGPLHWARLDRNRRTR